MRWNFLPAPKVLGCLVLVYVGYQLGCLVSLVCLQIVLHDKVQEQRCD